MCNPSGRSALGGLRPFSANTRNECNVCLGTANGTLVFIGTWGPRGPFSLKLVGITRSLPQMALEPDTLCLIGQYGILASCENLVPVLRSVLRVDSQAGIVRFTVCFWLRTGG